MSMLVLRSISLPITSRSKLPFPSGQLLRRVPPLECWRIEKEPHGMPKCQTCLGWAASNFSLLKVDVFKMSWEATILPFLRYSTGSSISSLLLLLKCSVNLPFPAKISRNLQCLLAAWLLAVSAGGSVETFCAGFVSGVLSLQDWELTFSWTGGVSRYKGSTLLFLASVSSNSCTPIDRKVCTARMSWSDSKPSLCEDSGQGIGLFLLGKSAGFLSVGTHKFVNLRSETNNHGMQLRSLWFRLRLLDLPFANAPTTTRLSHKLTTLHPPLLLLHLALISCFTISISKMLMCSFFLKPILWVDVQQCFCIASTSGVGASSIAEGGSRWCISQSNLVCSPFCSPKRYNVFASAFDVIVLARPPFRELASVADIRFDTGERTFVSANGSNNIAVMSSSFTNSGIRQMSCSGMFSMYTYIWWKVAISSRLCMNGCTKSPNSFCRAFFEALPSCSKAIVKASICFIFGYGVPTLPLSDVTWVPQALKSYSFSNAFFSDLGSWSSAYLFLEALISFSSSSSPLSLFFLFLVIWNTRWSSI